MRHGLIPDSTPTCVKNRFSPSRSIAAGFSKSDATRCAYPMAAPPMLSPHSIVCGLKAHSSGVLRREFKELTTMPTLWTREYLVAAGDELTPEQVLTAYMMSLTPRRPRGRPPCRH